MLMKHSIKELAPRINRILPSEMMIVTMITKIMEHFKVTLKLHRTIRGTLESKVVLEMTEMSGKEPNNRHIKVRPKPM